MYKNIEKDFEEDVIRNIIEHNTEEGVKSIVSEDCPPKKKNKSDLILDSDITICK